MPTVITVDHLSPSNTSLSYSDELRSSGSGRYLSSDRESSEGSFDDGSWDDVYEDEIEPSESASQPQHQPHRRRRRSARAPLSASGASDDYPGYGRARPSYPASNHFPGGYPYASNPYAPSPYGYPPGNGPFSSGMYGGYPGPSSQYPSYPFQYQSNPFTPGPTPYPPNPFGVPRTEYPTNPFRPESPQYPSNPFSAPPPVSRYGPQSYLAQQMTPYGQTSEYPNLPHVPPSEVGPGYRNPDNHRDPTRAMWSNRADASSEIDVKLEDLNRFGLQVGYAPPVDLKGAPLKFDVPLSGELIFDTNLSLKAPKAALKNVETMCIGSSRGYNDDDGLDTVVLVRDLKPSSTHPPHIRWIHLQNDHMSLESLQKTLSRDAGLGDEDALLARQLLDKIEAENEKEFVHGHYLEPLVIRCDGKSPKGIISEERHCTFLSFPYFSNQQAPTSSKKDLSRPHPVQGLLQTLYSFESTKARDLKQVISKSQKKGENKSVHVPQVWAIILNTDTIITYSSHSLSTLRGSNIQLTQPLSTIRTSPSVIHVTDPEGRLYFFSVDQCRTWFELSEILSSQCLPDGYDTLDSFQLLLKDGRPVTAATWPNILATETVAFIDLVIHIKPADIYDHGYPPPSYPRPTAARYGPSPYAPSPYAPSQYAPSPYAPSHYAPSQYAPSTFAASPNVLSPYAPPPYAPSAFAPSPYASSPYAPSPYSSAPYAANGSNVVQYGARAPQPGYQAPSTYGITPAPQTAASHAGNMVPYGVAPTVPQISYQNPFSPYDEAQPAQASSFGGDLNRNMKPLTPAYPDSSIAPHNSGPRPVLKTREEEIEGMFREKLISRRQEERGARRASMTTGGARHTRPPVRNGSDKSQNENSRQNAADAAPHDQKKGGSETEGESKQRKERFVPRVRETVQRAQSFRSGDGQDDKPGSQDPGFPRPSRKTTRDSEFGTWGSSWNEGSAKAKNEKNPSVDFGTYEEEGPKSNDQINPNDVEHAWKDESLKKKKKKKTAFASETVVIGEPDINEQDLSNRAEDEWGFNYSKNKGKSKKPKKGLTAKAMAKSKWMDDESEAENVESTLQDVKDDGWGDFKVSKKGKKGIPVGFDMSGGNETQSMNPHPENQNDDEWGFASSKRKGKKIIEDDVARKPNEETEDGNINNPVLDPNFGQNVTLDEGGSGEWKGSGGSGEFKKDAKKKGKAATTETVETSAPATQLDEVEGLKVDEEKRQETIPENEKEATHRSLLKEATLRPHSQHSPDPNGEDSPPAELKALTDGMVSSQLSVIKLPSTQYHWTGEELATRQIRQSLEVVGESSRDREVYGNSALKTASEYSLEITARFDPNTAMVLRSQRLQNYNKEEIESKKDYTDSRRSSSSYDESLENYLALRRNSPTLTNLARIAPSVAAMQIPSPTTPEVSRSQAIMPYMEAADGRISKRVGDNKAGVIINKLENYGFNPDDDLYYNPESDTDKREEVPEVVITGDDPVEEHGSPGLDQLKHANYSRSPFAATVEDDPEPSSAAAPAGNGSTRGSRASSLSSSNRKNVTLLPILMWPTKPSEVANDKEEKSEENIFSKTTDRSKQAKENVKPSMKKGTYIDESPNTNINDIGTTFQSLEEVLQRIHERLLGDTDRGHSEIYKGLEEGQVKDSKFILSSPSSEFPTSRQQSPGATLNVTGAEWKGKSAQTPVGYSPPIDKGVSNSNGTIAPDMEPECQQLLEQFSNCANRLLEAFAPPGFSHTVVGKYYGALKAIIDIIKQSQEQHTVSKKARQAHKDTQSTLWIIQDLPSDIVNKRGIPAMDHDFLDCPQCTAKTIYGSQKEVREHLRTVHFNQSTDLNYPPLDVLSNWIKRLDRLADERRCEEQMRILKACNDCLTNLEKVVSQVRDGVSTQDQKHSARFRLPRSFVLGFRNLLVLLMYTVHILQSIDKKSTDWVHHWRWNPARDSQLLEESAHLERIGYDSLEALEKGKIDLKMMITTRDFTRGVTYEAVGPQYILAMLLGNLQVGPDSHNLWDVYKDYTDHLAFQVSQRPRRRLLRDFFSLSEEITAVMATLEKQDRVLQEYSRVLAPSSFRLTSRSRQSLFTLEARLLHKSSLSIRKKIGQYLELKQQVDRQIGLTKMGIEILDDDHGKAILVFTIVTLVFLPLSFVTSFMGMNTVDIRNQGSTQVVFWEVAVPLTTVVIGLALLVGYKFEAMREWAGR